MSNNYHQTLFLDRYNVDRKLFEAADFEWVMLERIVIDYRKHKLKLEAIAVMLSTSLMKMEKVHSVSYRIKDDENLIEQILRRRIKDKEIIVDVTTYLEEITDLISLQAMHLFKEDCSIIHQEVTNYWDLKETPKVYIRTRDGDSPSEELLKEDGIIEEYQYGYRSIHYVIITKPAKTTYYAEVQVRTIY